MACREGRESSAVTGISVRELSSNHRCLRERTPLKAQAGTSDSRLASRRLWGEIITKSKYSVCLCACVSLCVHQRLCVVAFKRFGLQEGYYENYTSLILLLSSLLQL